MRAFLLAAAFASVLTAGAMAQAYDPSPRDPPFGKGNPGNDTYNLPNQTDIGSWGAAHGSPAYAETGNGTRSRRVPVTRPQ